MYRVTQRRFLSPRRPDSGGSAASTHQAQTEELMRRVFPLSQRHAVKRAVERPTNLGRQLKNEKQRLTKPHHQRLYPTLTNSPKDIIGKEEVADAVSESTRKLLQFSLRGLMARVPTVRSPTSKSRNSDKTMVIGCEEKGASDLISHLVKELAGPDAQCVVVDQSAIVYAIHTLRLRRQSESAPVKSGDGLTFM
jgi:hypothetical protein